MRTIHFLLVGSPYHKQIIMKLNRGQCGWVKLNQRQRGRLVRVLDLKSGDPEFKSHADR